jgi:ABC-type uncharacterized transport system substrate-binding protein
VKLYQRNRRRVRSVTKRAALLLGVIALFIASTLSADAQQKTPRVGYLNASAAASSLSRAEAFRSGLHELGYAEGKNIVIEWRHADARFDRLRALATELVRLKVDVIVTGGGSSTRAAKEATSAIPIVMAQDNDPVGNGFVTSLARPGGNVTGLATFAIELAGKRLQLLQEIVPKTSRVAVFSTSTSPSNAQSLTEIEDSGRRLGLQLRSFDMLKQEDINPALQAAAKWRADGILVHVGALFNSHRDQFIGWADKNRVPGIYPFIEFVESGGLAVYAPNYPDLFRRAAYFVDKIIKGAKPADLPVEQPTKFELVINLKAAKQIGLTIPPNVLARADRVIK